MLGTAGCWTCERQQFLRKWDITEEDSAALVQALRRVMFQAAERRARFLLGNQLVDGFKEAIR
jgi:hypothetical protein